MDGESLRVGDPKIWEQGWMGVPKEGESQKKGAGVGGGRTPKQEESQNVGEGVDGGPKGWEILIEGEQQWMGNP